MAKWMNEYEGLLVSLGIGSAFLFVGSVVCVPLILAYLPADFFVRDPVEINWKHPGGLLFRVLKNFVGIVLVLAGILMLLLPGQGLLSILLGVSLLDFRAKRDWQVALIRNRGIKRGIGWIRRKLNRPQLILPEPAES